MNREQLRTVLLGMLSRVQNSIAWWSATVDQKSVILASQRFWSADDGTQLDRLLLDLPATMEMDRIFHDPSLKEKLEMATAPKTFDPAALLARLEALLQRMPQMIAILTPIIEMLIALLGGTQLGKQSFKCDPSCDCGQCLDCSICCTVHALVAQMQAKACVDACNPPVPVP